MLCHLTFQMVMQEMKLPFVVCDFEADHDIAALANKLKCPVLSRDSDFFVYIIEQGFIPLDKFVLSDIECTCMIYHARNMTNVFGGLSVEKLPLLGVALGNDYVNRKYLYSFYSSLERNDVKQWPYEKLSNVQRKVIQWVQESWDINEAVCVLKRSAPEVAELIQVAFDSYTCTEHFDSKFDLVTYFEDPQTSDMCMQLRRSAIVSVFIQNVLKLKEIFLKSEVEDIRDYPRLRKHTKMFG